MSFPVIYIANHFINKGPCGSIKLHKYVYISYGLCFAMINQRLTNESPCAWPLGPVFQKLYKEVKKIGYVVTEELNNEGRPKEASLVEFLDLVWDRYGDKSDFALSDLTHKKGSPWDVTYNKKGGKWGRIDDSLIKEYYGNGRFSRHDASI